MELVINHLLCKISNLMYKKFVYEQLLFALHNHGLTGDSMEFPNSIEGRNADVWHYVTT